jgi:hypothetical protein
MSSFAATVLILSLAQAGTPAVPAKQPQPVDIVQSAHRAVERLEKADYAGVVTMFSVKLREKFPESKVRQTWDSLHRTSGRIVRTGEPITKTKDNLRRVIIPAQLEKGKVEIEVVFNAEGLVAGLLLHRPAR